MFIPITSGFATAVVNLIGGTIADVNVTPGNASATYTLTSAGVESYTTIASGSGTIGNWVTPTSYAGSGYDVRATKNSGTDPSGSALATWLSLGSTQSWDLSQSGVGSKSCNLTVEIRNAVSLVVLETATVDLSADVTL